MVEVFNYMIHLSCTPARLHCSSHDCEIYDLIDPICFGTAPTVLYIGIVYVCVYVVVYVQYVYVCMCLRICMSHGVATRLLP